MGSKDNTYDCGNRIKGFDLLDKIKKEVKKDGD